MDKKIIINGKGHIAGRLAANIAKNLLEGFHVTVLFSESIVYAFPIERAKKIYKDYLHKRCVVNPRKGPYHYVEPSKYFTRLVKRMLPHKKTKGANALKRLKVYESCPEDLWETEPSVCPRALLKYKAKPFRKSCTFGELLKDFGWKHFQAVSEMNLKYEEEKIKRVDEKERNLKCVDEMLASKDFARLVEERMKELN